MTRRLSVITFVIFLLPQAVQTLAQTPSTQNGNERTPVHPTIPVRPGVVPRGLPAGWPKSIEALKALHALQVVIDSSFEKLPGMNGPQLKADAEKLLGDAGIETVDNSNNQDITPAPTLRIELETVKDRDNEAYFLIVIRLIEKVNTLRDVSRTVDATTWHSSIQVSMNGSVLLTRKNQLIQQGVTMVTNTFIRDYSAANQR